MNAKKAPNNKVKYVSKADREKLALEQDIEKNQSSLESAPE